MSLSWHLAIESSGLGGSVALFHYDSHHQGDLHSQQVLPPNRGSVQTLAPAIDQLLRAAHVNSTHLSSLSVTCGPGSFTGLRVGLATAKMLAWAARIPVVPVDTLEAIALRFAQTSASTCGALTPEYRLVAAINAFRKQVFTSSWRVSHSHMQCVLPARVADVGAWLADPWQAADCGDGNCEDVGTQDQLPLWISGGAIGAYPGLDTTRCQLSAAEWWQPLAEQVGQLGLRGLAQGSAVTAHQLSPNYIRSSAAEENAK